MLEAAYLAQAREPLSPRVLYAESALDYHRAYTWLALASAVGVALRRRRRQRIFQTTLMRYAARWPDMLALGLYPLVVVISFVLRPLAWTLQSQWLRMQI